MNIKKYLTVNHAVLLGLLTYLISNFVSVGSLNKRLTKVEGFFAPVEELVIDPATNQVSISKP